MSPSQHKETTYSPPHPELLSMMASSRTSRSLPNGPTVELLTSGSGTACYVANQTKLNNVSAPSTDAQTTSTPTVPDVRLSW